MSYYFLANLPLTFLIDRDELQTPDMYILALQ